MPALPTLPTRSWLERTSLILSAGVAGIGAAGIAGWWLHLEELMAPFPGFAPIRFNEALALLVLGGALLALELGTRAVAHVALVASAIGALTLLEHIFGFRNLHLDEFFVRDVRQISAEAPGRMSAMVATCLLLAGSVIAWRAYTRGARERLFAEAVVGSVIASAGLSTLLGYGAELPTVYFWGTATATAPFAAIALVLLGFALLVRAWRENLKIEGGPPAWSPILAVVACLTLTVILWVGLRQREREYLLQDTSNATDALATAFKLTLDQQTRELERLGRNWGAGAEISATLWQADAAGLLKEARKAGAVSIAYVDESLHTVWIFPVEGNEGAVGFSHAEDDARASAIKEARKFNNATLSATTKISYLNQLPLGFVLYTPITRANRPTGYIAEEFIYVAFFDALLGLRQNIDQLRTDYSVTAKIGSETVYQSNAEAGRRSNENTVGKTYTIADRAVRLILTPSEKTLGTGRRYLPELALGAGIGISLLLGLSVHLARSARAGQRAAELSNKKLFAENEERRRIEARLKVSDERLRLALDSTQIGIFEWSVPSGHVYYSPGLWAMLGFEHGRMPSTVEAWQSLVHPDDLPLYRHRIEAQLAGLASFIEPEYRVRARSGEWRWVYTRSKAVATATDGKPTRIIGTVQDITARREAELALRESQAEARKLSLVAAKTDNPVLIGAPDGRIEWANEAFCRVMEYSLDEVVGKSPAHFMIGPETNPRTVARIRAAMAHGHGISTDIVNYSKSGRKYHLHFEIQPVHGAGGEVETFIAVGTDITARVDTELQLRRAKTEADEASRAKSDFLASMSHEIRTPMNGVIGMTSLLMETTLSAEQRDYINTIRTSGEALLTIINDILDFSKIESGKMELERAPFELSLCVEEALDLFAFQASSKHLELVYHIAPDVPPWIIGDVTRLRQVLVNLVNNAVKFTPKGSIAIEVRRAHRLRDPLDFTPSHEAQRAILEFTVRDTGIGIPAERVGRLFKAFSQVDSSITRKYGGTGLGLAICQRLCELMGGVIRVESTPGAGSAFVFTIQTEPAAMGTDSGLPVLPAAVRESGVLCIEPHPVTQTRLRTLFEKWGAPCTVVDSAPAALATVEKLPRPPALVLLNGGESELATPLAQIAAVPGARLVMFPFGQISPVAPADSPPFASISKPLRTTALTHAIATLFNPLAAAAAAAAKVGERPIADEFPLEVLLAEDNAVNQKVALRFLDRLGYRADAVANGLEVLKAIEGRRYDLVLMDLQMPEMDGLEASRQIRTRFPADRQPKIIALTANAMQGDRETCLAAGMDDYITKPVKMHEIAAAIRRQFGAPATTTPRTIG